MATIPLGEYGRRIARPAGPASIPLMDGMARAIGQTGDTIGAINNDLMAQDARLAERTRLAQAALTMARTTNALHADHDEVQRQVMSGELQPDAAAGAYRKAFTKTTEKTLDGHTPDQRTQMQAHFEQVGGTLGRSVQNIADERRRQDLATSIDQFGEEQQRFALREGPAGPIARYGSMVDAMAPTVGMSPAQVQKLKQTFSEKTHAAFFQMAGVAAHTNNDDVALGNLVQQLKGADGDPLDPARRAVLTHELYGWQQSILAKKARAANAVDDEGRRRYNEAVDVVNKAVDLSISGAALDKEFISEIVTKAAGTGLEAWAGAIVGGQTALSGFATKPADERAAILERLRNERGTTGTNPLNDKVFAFTEATQDKLAASIKENPWAAAQRVGVIADAPLLSAADPVGALDVVRRRMAELSRVERWTGKRESPLQPQEVEQVGKMVRQMPLDQAASMLAGIGATVGDADRVALLGKQMHDKDGALGLAMMYASAKTPEGRYTAELLLRGQQAIEDKTVTIDAAKETGWKGKIAKAIRGAYSNPEAEANAIKAAFLIAAANYAKGDGVDIDRAVNLATGGIIERNGRKIPLPYGMSEDQFDKRLAAVARTDQVAQQAPDGFVYTNGVPMPIGDFLASLPSAGLVHAGQAVYNVRAGTTLITNKDGKRITIKVTP